MANEPAEKLTEPLFTTHLALIVCLSTRDLRMEAVASSANDQMNWGIQYDGRYVKLPYPGGDVPRDRGVCSDVIVRAWRAIGLDFQRLVHEDMKSAWREYPRYGGLSRPDSNIDHRRVKNLSVFLRRHGKSLPFNKDWQLGDIVTWIIPGNLDHIGVVVGFEGGEPILVHNYGGMYREKCLTRYRIVGHYRYPR